MADLVDLATLKSWLNIELADTSQNTELELRIDAVTAHVERAYGILPSGSYTQFLAVENDGYGTYRHWLRPYHSPILTVTSATDESGTAYTTGFTISTDGRAVRHTNVSSGEWTLVYTAGFAAIPVDLKLAVLEDLKVVHQRSQIGPPGAAGFFGASPDDFAPMAAPIGLYPRVDAWVRSVNGPAIA